MSRVDELLNDGRTGGTLLFLTSQVELDRDVFEGVALSLHQFSIDGPKLRPDYHIISQKLESISYLVKLVGGEAGPQLVVILLLHLGDHLPAVLQLVGLLQAGHEDRLHLFSSSREQLV